MITADTHYNPTRFDELYTLERIKDKDFVIFDGDMVTTFANEKSHFDKLFSHIQKTFEHFNTQFYFVRGNHDARGNHAQYFLDYYPTWTNMPYFAFRHGPVFVLAVDGGEDKPDSDIEYYGTAAFDLYREAQGKWLESVFETEEFKTATHRIIVSHIPLTENSWHGGRHAWQHISQRCEDKGFDIMISGHLHKHRFYEAGVHNRTFPTLVIGADKFLDAKADKDVLTLELKNMDGTLIKTYTYKKTKSGVVRRGDLSLKFLSLHNFYNRRVAQPRRLGNSLFFPFLPILRRVSVERVVSVVEKRLFVEIIFL